MSSAADDPRQRIAVLRAVRDYARAHREVKAWGLAEKVALFDYVAQVTGLPRAEVEAVAERLAPVVRGFAEALDAEMKRRGVDLAVVDTEHADAVLEDVVRAGAFRRRLEEEGSMETRKPDAPAVARTVRVVFVDVGRPPEIRSIAPELKPMQELIGGGYVETVNLDRRAGPLPVVIGCFFDEDGRSKELPRNRSVPVVGETQRRAFGATLEVLGPLFVAATQMRDGELVDLTDAEVAAWLARLAR